MAALLLRWVNSLGVSCLDLERDFSNGVLFGDVLLKYQVISSSQLEEFSRNDDVQSKMDNFDILESVFMDKLGIGFDPKLVGKVIQQEPGAVAKLLFQIKCALEPESAPPKEKVLSWAEKEKRDKEAQFLRQKKRVPRRALPNPDLELAVRGKLPKKELQLALKLAKFEEVRIKQENKVNEREIQEEELFEKLIQQRRDIRREKLVKNRTKLVDWEVDMEKDWVKNERVKDERIEKELQFELTQQANDKAKAMYIKDKKGNEVKQCTENFERNLKRLGLEDEESNINNNNKLEEKRDFVEAVKLELEKGKLEDELYMKKLKAHRLEAIEGRKKREQRRLKLLVDQQIVEKQVSQKRQNETLLKRLAKEATEERSRAALNRRNRHKQIQKQEMARLNARKLIEERDSKFIQVVQRDKELALQRKKEFQENILPEKKKEWERLKEEEKIRKKEEMNEIVRDTVNLLVGLFFKVADKRYGEDEKRNLHPQEWRDLKKHFIKGATAVDLSSLENTKKDNSGSIRSLAEPVEEQIAESDPMYAKLTEICDNLTTKSNQHAQERIASLESNPIEQIQTTLDFLKSNNLPRIEPSRYSHGVMLLGLPKNEKFACKTVLIHKFGLKIIDVNSYLRVQSTIKKEDDEEEIEKSERDLLIDAVSKIEERDKRLNSTELVKLIAYDVKKLKGGFVILGGSTWPISHFTLFEYLLSIHGNGEYRSVEEFLRKEDRENLTKHKTLMCCVTLGSHINDDERVNLENRQVEIICMKDACSFEKEFQALKGVADLVEPREVSLLRNHYIAKELSSKQNFIDMDNVESLWTNWQQNSFGYKNRVEKCFHVILELEDAANAQVEELKAIGVGMIRGDAPPSDSFYPKAEKQRAIENFEERVLNGEIPFDERFVLYDKAIDRLGNNLWDISFEYSEIVSGVFEQWQNDNFALDFIKLMCLEYNKLVDLELKFYTLARELVKDYYSKVDVIEGEDVQKEEENDEEEDLPATPPSTPNTLPSKTDSQLELVSNIKIWEIHDEAKELYKKFKQAARTIERRQKRGENIQNPCPNEATKALSWLNECSLFRINFLASHAKELIGRLTNQFEISFEKLDSCISHRLKCEDENLRNFISDAKTQIRDLYSSNGEFSKLPKLSNNDQVVEILF